MPEDDDLTDYEMPREIYEGGVLAIRRAFDEGWRRGHAAGLKDALQEEK